jgi:acyl dehydratase
MSLNLAAIGEEWDMGECSWTQRDAILYALGVGAGALDPNDELAFTTESSRGVTPKVLPTFAVVINTLHGSVKAGPKLGDYTGGSVLHAEQSVTLHAELPAEGSARLTSRVAAMYDKGMAALIVVETAAIDAKSGDPLYDMTYSIFVRGEGGFGGERGPNSSVDIPGRAADHVVTYLTRPEQALLYRMSGDTNPLHSDPSFAKDAGLQRPILHGLCTFGFTGRALLHTLCDSDPTRFGSMSSRFTAPVLPGQSLEIHIWVQDDLAVFQTRTDGVVALDRGAFRWRRRS